MTSKERCEALMEYIVEENQGYFDKERIGNDLTAILIDLEDYEKLKNLMGTPIQDIMKRLKILEIMTEFLRDGNTGTGWIEINIDPDHDILDSEEHKKKQLLIKEWLENGKNNL